HGLFRAGSFRFLIHIPQKSSYILCSNMQQDILLRHNRKDTMLKEYHSVFLSLFQHQQEMTQAFPPLAKNS
ncbi:MAG: hypothetical protein IJY52_02600, partial [Anaerotignum sp.]|nr:hypothetical protein [Anaerotignum sp.]